MSFTLDVEFHITRRFLVSVESKLKLKKRWQVLMDISSNYGYIVSLVNVFVFARFSIYHSITVKTNLVNFPITLIIA